MFENLAVAMYSLGRNGRIRTLSALGPEVRNLVTLVVPEKEVRKYEISGENDPTQRAASILAIPERVQGIAQTRQYVTEATYSAGARYLLQLSDDITGFFWRDSETKKLYPLPPERSAEMVEAMLSAQRMGYPHVGISQRGFNNWYPDLRECKRMCDVYLHDLQVLAENGIRWDRVPVMEDFDVTLSLLRRGYNSAVLCNYAWDQAKSNAAGGCSTYRTPELQERGAKLLAELHPEFAKAKPKAAANWDGFGGQRWDCTVQWQKAYAASDLKGQPMPAWESLAHMDGAVL